MMNHAGILHAKKKFQHLIIILQLLYQIPQLCCQDSTNTNDKAIVLDYKAIADTSGWELGVLYDASSCTIGQGKLGWSRSNISKNIVIYPHLYTSAEVDIQECWKDTTDKILVAAEIQSQLNKPSFYAEVRGYGRYATTDEKNYRKNTVRMDYKFLQQFEMISGKLLHAGLDMQGLEFYHQSGQTFSHICTGILRGGYYKLKMDYEFDSSKSSKNIEGEMRLNIGLRGASKTQISGKIKLNMSNSMAELEKHVTMSTDNSFGISAPQQYGDALKLFQSMTQKIAKKRKKLRIDKVWLTPIDMFINRFNTFLYELKGLMLNKIIQIQATLATKMQQTTIMMNFPVTQKFHTLKYRLQGTWDAIDLYMQGMNLRFQRRLSQYRYSDVTALLMSQVAFHTKNPFHRGFPQYLEKLQMESDALYAITNLLSQLKNFNVTDNPERDREDKAFTVFFVFTQIVKYDRFLKLLQVTAKFVQTDSEDFPEFRFKSPSPGDTTPFTEVIDTNGILAPHDPAFKADKFSGLPNEEFPETKKAGRPQMMDDEFVMQEYVNTTNADSSIQDEEEISQMKRSINIEKTDIDSVRPGKQFRINNLGTRKKHFLEKKNRLSGYIGGDLDPRPQDRKKNKKWPSLINKKRASSINNLNNDFIKSQNDSSNETVYYEELPDDNHQVESSLFGLLHHETRNIHLRRRENRHITEFESGRQNIKASNTRFKRQNEQETSQSSTKMSGNFFIPQPWFLDDVQLAGIVRNFILLKQFIAANEKVDNFHVAAVEKNSFHPSIQNMLEKYDDKSSVLILSENFQFTQFDWHVPSNPGKAEIVQPYHDHLLISWIKPFSGFENVDKYLIHVKYINVNARKEKHLPIIEVDGEDTQCTLPNLKINSKYKIQIDCIVKKHHPSTPTTFCPPSQQSEVYTLGSSEPQNLSLETNNKILGREPAVGYFHIYLKWEHPKFIHADVKIIGYHIRYSTSNNQEEVFITICNNQTHYKVEELQDGTSHKFFVSAVYSGGSRGSNPSKETPWITTLKQDRYCISKGELALPTNKWETYGWWIPPSNNDQCFGNFLIPKVPVSDLLDTPQVTAQQSVNDCLSRDSAHILQLSSTEERDLIMEKYGDFFLLGLKQVRSTSFIVKVGRINISTNSVSDQITIDDQTTEEDLEGQSLWTWMDSGEIMDGLEIEKNLITHEKSYSVIKRIKVEELKDIDNEDKIPQGDENVIDSEDSNCIVATRFGWIKIGCHYIHHNFICGNKALPCEEEEDDDADMDDEEDEEQEQDTHSQDADISIAEQEYDENEDYEY